MKTNNTIVKKMNRTEAYAIAECIAEQMHQMESENKKNLKNGAMCAQNYMTLICVNGKELKLAVTSFVEFGEVSSVFTLMYCGNKVSVSSDDEARECARSFAYGYNDAEFEW